MDSQQQRRIEMGLQCPECYGVNVNGRNDRFQASAVGFECQDCGCNWAKNYFYKISNK